MRLTPDASRRQSGSGGSGPCSGPEPVVERRFLSLCLVAQWEAPFAPASPADVASSANPLCRDGSSLMAVAALSRCVSACVA